ncbi:E3 ubiquitin-protein ligase SH3RF1 [Nymphon striatum]|nr:E3 ubiquitin-protein ligase SH3RF1 [Nymphon striatum]
MDEGILNELLECSVCLEGLDSTSKVLPCQHTFCKRCLEEIVMSRNELRCPECRILVQIKIPDLPNNFLLIRLLEGIRSNAKISKNEENNSVVPNPERQGNQNGENSDPNKSTTEVKSRKTLNETTSRKESLTFGLLEVIFLNNQLYILLHSHLLVIFRDLSFKKGDIIMLKKKIDQNWYHGELGSKHGFFPATYVQLITPLPNHLPQAKALYDFTCHEGDGKDCLTFKKGDIITVIRRVDENWIEGRIFNKVGIFPITFVEMNSTAREIIKLSTSLKAGPVRDAPPAPQEPVVLSPTPSHIIPTSGSSDSSSTTSFSQSTDNNIITQNQPQSSSRSNATPTSTGSQILSISNPDLNLVTKSVIPQPLPQPPSHPRHLIHRQQREKRRTMASTSVTTSTSTRQNTASMHQPDHRHSMDASFILSPINIPSHIARPRAVSHPVDEQKGTKKSSVVPANVTTATTTASTCAITSTSEAISDSGTCYLVRRHSTNRREKTSSISHSRQHSAPDQSAISSRQHSGPDQTLLLSSSGHVLHKQTHYVAMYGYKPQKEDELELAKNELYIVSEKCLDGWYKGTSLKTGLTGVFPGNYVQLSKSPNHQGNSHHASSSHASAKNTPKATSQMSAQPNAQNTEQSRTNPSIPTTTAVNSRVNASIKSPPPRPPRPVLSAESIETSNTSPWVAKSEAKTFLPQPPKMTVTLPPHITQTSAAMASSIPVAVQASVNSKAVCSTTSSQSWHGVIPSTSKSLMSAATTLTPPNVSVSSSSSPSSKTTPSKTDKSPKDKKEKERVSDVFKRLTGVKKKSRSPPPTMSMDNPNFIDLCGIGSSAVHVRSGSCPSDSSSSTSHKKTMSVDTSLPHSNAGASTPRPKQPAPLVRERYLFLLILISLIQILASYVTNSLLIYRFRCIVPYPPNSDYELELKVGDIIYVHKKRDDGWYKGTLQRTGVTGLFPGSFVETF